MILNSSCCLESPGEVLKGMSAQTPLQHVQLQVKPVVYKTDGCEHRCEVRCYVMKVAKGVVD